MQSKPKRVHSLAVYPCGCQRGFEGFQAGFEISLVETGFGNRRDIEDEGSLASTPPEVAGSALEPPLYLFPVYHGFFVGHLSAIKVVVEIAVIAAREKATSSKGGSLSLPSCSHELTQRSLPRQSSETASFLHSSARTLSPYKWSFRSTDGFPGGATQVLKYFELPV